MGCAFSKRNLRRQQKKQKLPNVSSSSSIDCDFTMATNLALGPPKPDTAIPIPAIKCTKAYQGLGDFSNICFMVGEKEKAYLPACLADGGYNRHGQQIVCLNSHAYCRESTDIDSIRGAIHTLTAGGEFILVYKNNDSGTAYLPHDTLAVRKLFHHLATWFDEKLAKIVILKPSWYLMLCIEEQISTGLLFLSETTMRKVHMTNNQEEFA